MRSNRSAGFTLIELLIVIGIIALLAVAFAPAITQALTRGEEAETIGRQQFLVTAIDAFVREYGFAPPDDLSGNEQLGIKTTADKINAGIESVVIYLSWTPRGAGRLDEKEAWLANTDGDQNVVPIPLLQRTAKMEVLDGWGTPFAYFHNANYQKSQTIRTKDIGEIPGVEMEASARKNPRSAGYLAPRGYQLISAGPDLTFGTDDDIVHPEPPRD
jgi:prepilin-type N-terminal cleavage/methylation domain-containing protein